MKPNFNQQSAPVISVKGISKKFCRDLHRSLLYGVKDTFREFFYNLRVQRELRHYEFWTLKDISFDLNSGESLAIIGENGAGKSTLLKILYGLIKPDRGEVRIKGKVAALIELGTNFEQTLSGRENIYYTASLLGFPEPLLPDLVDKAIAFSELGEFIDIPVQFYSSGMVARLAYSIASNLDSSILLIDEVLAVGDTHFQRKCINHMTDFINSGGSLILVSHSPFHIQSICQRGIFIKDGKIEFDGTAIEALSKYQASKVSDIQHPEANQSELTDDRPIKIEEVSISSVDANSIYTHSKVKISIKYQSIRKIGEVGFSFMLSTSDNLICIAGDINPQSNEIDQGTGEVNCIVNDFPLLPGNYLLKTTIYQTSNYWSFANTGFDNPALKFKVAETVISLSSSTSKMLNQLVSLNCSWEIIK